MSDDTWGYLHSCFSVMDESCAKMIAPQINPALGVVANTEPNGNLEASGMNIVAVYEEMINNIKLCRKNLERLVKKEELTYLIQALIFHYDEMVLTKTMNSTLIVAEGMEWPGLQQSLVHCRNGGERFFRNLNKLLQHQRDNKIAIEVYFFCLKRGFMGCYFNKPNKIQPYLADCSNAILKNARLGGFLQEDTGLMNPERFRRHLSCQKNSGAQYDALTE